VWGAGKRDAALRVGEHTALLRCRPVVTAAAAAAATSSTAAGATAGATVEITAMCSHSALAPLVREALVHKALQLCEQPAAAATAATATSSSSGSSGSAAAVTVGGAAALAQAGALWEQYDADAAADDTPYEDREGAALAVVQSVLRAYTQLREASASTALS
jgi:hypothetical protein